MKSNRIQQAKISLFISEYDIYLHELNFIFKLLSEHFQFLHFQFLFLFKQVYWDTIDIQ